MRVLLITLLTALTNLLVNGQDSLHEDGPTGHDQIEAPQPFEGETERTDFDFKSFTIIPCRKVTLSELTFPRYYKADWSKYKDPLEIGMDKLSYADKMHLYELIVDTKNPKYFALLAKLIFSDTVENDADIRKNLCICLGEYETEPSKKLLQLLLKDRNKAIATIAAINLVKIRSFDRAINYFTNNYNNDFYVEYVYSALMFINSEQSVNLLKRFAKEQSSPVLAIDALAALSLLGNCDYAFNELKKYLTSDKEVVRKKSVSCIAYYIGTQEAFEVIEKMHSDESVIVRAEVEHVNQIYLKKNKSKK
jgi:hypothetical protein